MDDTETNKLVTIIDRLFPNFFPNKPAKIDPKRGKKTNA